VVTTSNAGVVAGAAAVLNSGTITVPLTVATNAPLGGFAVTVTNVDESSTTCSGCVSSVAPVLPKISGTPPTNGRAGEPYGPFTFTVTGDPYPSTTVSAGALPPGLSLDGVGNLAGTPITAGSYKATITAANGPTKNATVKVKIVVVPTLTL